MWPPDLMQRGGPRYRAIAEAIAEAIEAGGLTAGDRLPTHRALARRLGVTVGTVSRAYAEAERRGLVRGEVGRGTFVLPRPPGAVRFGAPEGREPGVIDLSLSVPPVPVNDEERRLLSQAFAELAEAADLPLLLDSQPHAGNSRHRAAGARWLRQAGLEVAPEQVVVTCGAQHAMAVAFATLATPGGVVLTENLTFPGMKAVANLLHLRLEGLATDGHGLRPDALEAACRRGESRLLYTIPTLQNPTASLMPEGRRQEIAAIARRHGLTVVEDDVYGFLPAHRPPPLAVLLPQQSYYLTSISKLIAPGLRVGFMAAPEGMAERLAASIWASTWMAPPAMAEIARRWIEEGTLRRMTEWKRLEMEARNALATRILAGAGSIGFHPASFHLWLPLPEPWRSEDFTLQGRRRGVAVTSAEAFVVGRGTAPHAVRVSLASPKDRRQLEKGLTILAELLEHHPEPCEVVV